MSCWMLVCLAFQPQVCRSRASAGVLGANVAAGMWDNIPGSCRGRSIPKGRKRVSYPDRAQGLLGEDRGSLGPFPAVEVGMHKDQATER